MLQENWGKYKQPFSRPSSTTKAEVAMSQFLEPNSTGLSLAKLTHYMFVTSKMLAPLQNTVHTSNWADIETESARLMAVV